MNKDQVKGTIKQVAGKVQQTTGKVIGSHEQELKGIKKQVEGEAQKAVGDIKEDHVDEVLILGHSLARVDLPYFELIAQYATQAVRYTITYFGAQSRVEAAEKCLKFLRSIDEVEFVDMASPNRLLRSAASVMERNA